MEIIISRIIVLFDNAVTSRTVTKIFESDVIPRKGDFIHSTAFEIDEEVEVSSVSIDYERNRCYVYLEPLSIESDNIKYLKQTVDMYMHHEWKCEFYALD